MNLDEKWNDCEKRKEHSGAIFLVGNNATIVRFASAKYLEKDPNRFYLNFLDSKRTFSTRHRLAGPECCSGFFFSQRPEVAMMEMMFYFNISEIGHYDPVRFLSHPQLTSDVIYMELEFERLEVMNLCDERSAEYIVSELMGDKSQRSHWDALDYFAHYMDQRKGGGYWEEMFSWHAARADISGISFPSRRALDCQDEALWSGSHWKRYTGFDAFTVRRNDEMGSADFVRDQLRSENNIVLYRGQKFLPMIKKYKIYFPDGEVYEEENPWFESTQEELGVIRETEAKRRGLNRKEAEEMGLVGFADYVNMFIPTGFWIPPQN